MVPGKEAKQKSKTKYQKLFYTHKYSKPQFVDD